MELKLELELELEEEVEKNDDEEKDDEEELIIRTIYSIGRRRVTT